MESLNPFKEKSAAEKAKEEVEAKAAEAAKMTKDAAEQVGSAAKDTSQNVGSSISEGASSLMDKARFGIVFCFLLALTKLITLHACAPSTHHLTPTT